jgi:hypothetical protein
VLPDLTAGHVFGQLQHIGARIGQPMRAILAAVVAIIAALMIGVALAEPTRLACEGEMRVQNANGERAENYVLSFAIGSR